MSHDQSRTYRAPNPSSPPQPNLPLLAFARVALVVMLLVRHAVDVAPSRVRSTVGALALAVAAANGSGVACSTPDSPWCDDTASCPAEVLYNDRIYVVECTDHILGFEPVSPTIPAQLRDQQVRVRYHLGDGETERRRAWTVHGVDPAKLIILDERDTTI